MKVLIAVEQENALTEGFIAAHIEHLRPKPVVASGVPAMVKDVFRFGFQPSLLIRFAMHRARGLRMGDRGVGRWLDQLCFAEILRRVKPDVVLAEFGTRAVAVLDACTHCRVPLVAHFHGEDSSRTDLLRELSSSYERLFAQAAGVVCVSRSMQSRLKGLGCPAERLHLNCYGVDCDVFSGGDPAHARPIVVTVGRFVNKKAPHLTILAFREVVREIPDAQLRMVGSGVLMECCEDVVKDLQLTDNVTFLGDGNQEQIVSELRGARCFAQHSVVARDGNREGTPNSVLEALACGVPVVATRHEGITDVMLDGQTGMLVDEHDVDAMAQAMTTLCRDPTLAGAMGQTARKHMLDNYSMPDRIRGLEEILARCVSESNR